MTTLDDIIQARAKDGLSDLLLAIYDYAYCLGAGIIPPPPARPGVIDLLRTLEAIHRIEVLAPRGWVTPPLTNDELPGWLLGLAQQADTIEPPPAEGWPV
jgi:hypothetical protein